MLFFLLLGCRILLLTEWATIFCCDFRGMESNPETNREEEELDGEQVRRVLQVSAATGKFWYGNFLFPWFVFTYEFGIFISFNVVNPWKLVADSYKFSRGCPHWFAFSLLTSTKEKKATPCFMEERFFRLIGSLSQQLQKFCTWKMCSSLVVLKFVSVSRITW